MSDEEKKEPVKEEPGKTEDKKIPVCPIVDSLKEKFKDGILDVNYFCGHHYIDISPDLLKDSALFLKAGNDVRFDYLSCVTGLHNPKDDKPFEVIYSLYSTVSRKDIHLRVKLKEGEKVTSLFSVWQSADWFEREVYDLFGVEFNEHPDLKRILLTDDWEGFPLRKDYPLEGPAESEKVGEKENA